MTHKVFAKAPTAMKLILLLGVVSLLGDIIYEGGRSVTGPYLLFLGASAFTVAWVSGLGEFIGYAIRLVSGYFADRTREYWTFSLAGYLMIGAIPLLVYTRSWEAAVVLLLIERLGKGIRSPAKDTILSHAAHQVGRGWGFGIHEAMDQIGAVAGPLVFAASLLLLGGYGEGFALLTIPFVLLIAALVLAWRRYPDPASMEESALSFGYTPKDPRVLLPYGAFTVLTMAGFLVFPLMAYHFSAAAVVPDPQIPIFFAVAMATDALAALLMGRLYDRWGLPVIIAIPIANIPIAPLAFSSGYFGALAAAVLWGVSMGGQETVLRAALADFTSIGKRGFAYGIFNTLYGASWFAGSLVFGLLYYVGAGAICAFSIFMQVAAMGAFFLLWRCAGRSSRGYSP
ncbi:MAG: Major Facilitator Superfamily protein [Methanoregulaceae archaeon PtaB.Bin009]|jgi:MFS family permease|nr:MAG: Major Facilitator Superfamily protein [Methanoregulaceae archaeon PtaB.Bin009]OPY40503.1 MAG: Major Facilitator Superfamily protein [Methanoregulaceae archaeon PtaU1.Bin066]HNQ28733.1 MFS transporter [Methanolinea sp.]